jgi:hypothetical protein
LRRNDGGPRHRVTVQTSSQVPGAVNERRPPVLVCRVPPCQPPLITASARPASCLRKVLTWTTTKSRAQRSLGVGPPATRWGPESPQQPPPPYQRRREIAGGRQPFGLFALAERRGYVLSRLREPRISNPPERVDPWFARFRLSGAVASACWRAQRNGASCMRASRLAGCNRSHARTDVLVGAETVHGLGYEVRERG